MRAWSGNSRAAARPPRAAGRKSALNLPPRGAYVIGIGIGAYEQWIRIADLRGDCVSRRAVQLLDQPSARAALSLLTREIRALLSLAKIPRRRVLGAGIASAGIVDRRRGVVVESPNLGWRELPIADIVSGALDLPVCVEAMHHALNLAEKGFGEAAGGGDTVLVNASMGIGASVMEQGRIVRGRHGAAGQIGHMSVPRAMELCTCDPARLPRHGGVRLRRVAPPRPRAAAPGRARA